MAKILVVDDEPDLVRFVRRALENDDHQVITALGGAEGLRMALSDRPDLVVLDLLMPDVDGRAVLQALLAVHPEMRILVLSAEADVGARIGVLEAGAVDFLAKPFAVRELVVRVRSRLSSPKSPDRGASPAMLCVGTVQLDIPSRTIRVDDRTVGLTQREFLLLRHLMRRADKVCTRQELLSEVWGYAFDPATNVVDVYVARLRRKLRGDIIHTVRNVGYRIQSG